MDEYKDKHKGAQKLYISDEKGKTSGEIVERWKAHTAPGVKHVAFGVLVLNAKNEIVLHKRPTRKVGGGVLDIPVSHILEGETKEQAMNRCLKEEYGITAKHFNHYQGFSYYEAYPDGTCENEYCLVSVIKHEGEFKPNPKEVEGEFVLLPAAKAVEEIKKNPQKYAIWFRKGIELLANDPRGRKHLT